MKIRTIAIAFALTIAVGNLDATEIYKWVDEDGVVHYVDLPTGAPGEEHVAIRSRPTNQATVNASMQALEKSQAARAERVEERATQAQSREEKLAAAQEREEKCNEYRARQTRFTNNRRIYRMDESGERVYYSEEEMQAARNQLDELVSQYCS